MSILVCHAMIDTNVKFACGRQDQLNHRQPRASYLLGRPANVVDALKLRASRAENMTCQLSECSGEGGHYLVAKSDETLRQLHYDDMNDMEESARVSYEEYTAGLSPQNRCYHVDFLGGACTCPDNQLMRMPCKHMFMVIRHTDHTFSDLPELLVSSPTMVVDVEVIQVCGSP
jgi:hypothetical protein